LIHEYPWTKLGENATVIDVGCGPGTTAMSIVKVHNKLNWVMLDLPEMVPGIKEVVTLIVNLTVALAKGVACCSGEWTGSDRST
jgi:hypothetical protein